MRVYKKIIIITTIITVVSFAIAIALHYFFGGAEAEFWMNVSLGIFGGAGLTALTSVVSYNYEKKKILREFSFHTEQILSFLNKYQTSMTLEQKLQFYLDYNDLDKSAWHMDMGDIDFVFERVYKNREYIYEKIYKPILDFNLMVSNRVWNFRWHLDGSGKNENVMQTFVNDLESCLIKKVEEIVPTEYDYAGNPTSYCRCASISYEFVANIKNELVGRYYEILYGKRKAIKLVKSQEDK